MKIGYFLSSEEYTPAELLAQARGAEQAGFEALWISDHYHPEMIDRYAKAGFDEVYVANTGPHWQGLFDLYQRDVLPQLR
ncbi:hypothetical protein [Micromonospora sp. DT227]|uniref:hypothetical protein n=1 Tax=Micromonospora sp. DT227 TaxID=3393433 RepID=UPI003CF2B55D